MHTRYTHFHDDKLAHVMTQFVVCRVCKFRSTVLLGK
jgi:hypothetical protein